MFRVQTHITQTNSSHIKRLDCLPHMNTVPRHTELHTAINSESGRGTEARPDFFRDTGAEQRKHAPSAGTKTKGGEGG